MTRRELVELLEDIPDDYLICISDESIRLLVAAGDAAVDEEARIVYIVIDCTTVEEPIVIWPRKPDEPDQ